MALVTILAILAAVWALRYATRQASLLAETERQANIDRAILRAAMMLRGRVTAVDVETRNVGTIEEIEDRLRVLHARGHCESELSFDGRHVYLFGSFDDSYLRISAVQKQIFLQAKIHGGYVDLTRTAMATDLTYQQVRDVLEQMVEDGLCVHADAPATYWFPSFVRREALALPEGDVSEDPRPLAEDVSEDSVHARRASAPHLLR